MMNLLEMMNSGQDTIITVMSSGWVANQPVMRKEYESPRSGLQHPWIWVWTSLGGHSSAYHTFLTLPDRLQKDPDHRIFFLN